jgi:hypothetical protein
MIRNKKVEDVPSPIVSKITILISFIAFFYIAYISYKNYPNLISNIFSNFPENNIDLIILVLALLAGIFPFLQLVDHQLKKIEYLKQNTFFTKLPKKIEVLSLITGFVLYIMSFKELFVTGFLFSILLMGLATIVVSAGFISLCNRSNKLQTINTILTSSFYSKILITLASFSLTSYFYGELNNIYGIDPSNFPLTLVFMFGFSIFITTISISMILSLISFFYLPVPSRAIDIFKFRSKNKIIRVKSLIRLYFLTYFIGVFFFWGSYAFIFLFNFDSNLKQILSLAAYELDFNGNYPCKNNTPNSTSKVLFLGPTHKLMLEVDFKYDASPKLIECDNAYTKAVQN